MLILESMEKHANPDPEGCDPGSEAVIPDPTLF